MNYDDDDVDDDDVDDDDVDDDDVDFTLLCCVSAVIEQCAW